jgi:hypothetical protein
MKVAILFIISGILYCGSNSIIGTYEIIDELSDDSLELRIDGTYTYLERGDSCFEWNDFEGDWILNNDELTLFENYKTEEPISELDEIYFDEAIDSVKILVESIDKKPIDNFKIRYYCYSPNYPSYLGTTNKNGIVYFKKYDINYIHYDESNIEFEIIVNQEKIGIVHSADQNADQLILTLNFSPDSIQHNFEHKFKFREERLTSTLSKRLRIGKEYKKL